MLSKSVTAPQREEIEPALLGMGLTTRGEVSRPFSRFSIVAVARNSDLLIFSILIFLLGKKVDQTEPPF